MQKAKITVLGSFVVDLMSKTPHLPARGETVFGGPFRLGPGGKGSNQGIAAQKAGADVTMITKLGRDVFADIALKSFTGAGMKTDYIYQDEKYETGVALIIVEDMTAENEIVVSIGACNHITREEIDAAGGDLIGSSLLLTQLETNIEAVLHAVDMAYEHGIPVVLNPAPVQKIPDELYKKIDILTPNETEAQILSGVEVNTVEDAAKASEFFLSKGVKSVIVTMGQKGVYVDSKSFKGHIPAFRVDNVIDTTGAGDAFNGGFVTALAEGLDIKDAAVFGSAVAAISVTRIGTAPAMPDRDEINAFLARHKG